MNKILNELIELQDVNYKEFNQKLCPDTNREMLGIRVPILRMFAKKILNDENYNWDEFVKNKEVKYFEEVLLQGLIIAYSELELKEKLKYIKQYISRIDSWAISDSFVPTLKIKENELEEYWNFILPYTKSKKEFDVRFAIISMLDYFINDTYVDAVIKELNKINHNGYYVKMGVAWTIAEIGIKYNEKAMEYLNGENNLDKFTFNKSLQKMIESFRITATQKEIFRKMKRK